MISLCLCRIGLVCVLLQLLVAAKVYNRLLSPLSSFLPIYQLQLQRISFSRFSSWCSFCWCRLAEQPVLWSSLLLFCCLVLLARCLLLLLVLHFLFPPLVPRFFLSHLRFLLQLFLALFLPALLPLPSCFLCSPLSSLLFLLLLSPKINLSQPQYNLNCSVYLFLLVVLDVVVALGFAVVDSAAVGNRCGMGTSLVHVPRSCRCCISTCA